MKKLLVTLLIAFASLPNAYGQGQSAREDGVGAGGSGGNPNAMGTNSITVRPNGIRPMGVTSFDNNVGTTSTTTMALPTDSAIVVNREELLKAVDAALNSTDLEMQINSRTRTVRPQKFDLSRGVLQGKILETNRTIRLIDESKAANEGLTGAQDR